MTTYTTVDLLTESGLNINTEDGHNFLIISRHLVVEVIQSGGGPWGGSGAQGTKWQPLETKYFIKVAITFKGKTWIQEKEVSPTGIQGLEAVRVAFKQFKRIVSEVWMYFRK